MSRICFGSSGRKGRKQGGAGHAEHVAEIGARRHEDVLEGIGEGRPPFPHPLQQNLQVFLQQNDVGRFPRHVDRAVDGKPGVGGVQGRGVVDAVPHETDDIAGLFRRQQDALLLVGLDLGEDIRLVDPMPESLIAHAPQVGPGQQPVWFQPDLAAHGFRHHPVVAGDHLQRNPKPGQSGDGFGDPRLGRIMQGQKADEGHPLFLFPADLPPFAKGLAGHPQHPQPLGTEPAVKSLDLLPDLGQRDRVAAASLGQSADVEHIGQRPLGHQQTLLPLGHHHAEPFAQEIVGFFPQLLPTAQIEGGDERRIASSRGSCNRSRKRR